MLGRAMRGEKEHPCHGLMRVVQPPVGASRAPNEAGSLREPFDRVRGAFLSARRVGRVPGRSEARRGPRGACAAKRPGRVSFGDFSLRVQRKVTCRGSATHKYTRPQAARQTCSPFDRPVLSRSHFDMLSANGRRAQGERCADCSVGYGKIRLAHPT